ncbi:MAG: glycosyltransferase family 9 protein [Candidatus Omnitrophica bacterium]|nr:glycosyltransferase family 9 protein [Candidatus Omnitrophota bacterium]
MARPDDIKRILVVRTDRIGDVVLSTPVLKVLREELPQAHIAFLTGPATKEVLYHNPHIDELIVYDKTGAERSWRGTLRFGLELRRKGFDTALILHTTNRAVWLAVLAGIPRRIGYARRLGRLLTHRLSYAKPEGKKHEVDYNFDLVRLLGVDRSSRELVWIVDPAEDEAMTRRLAEAGIAGEELIAVHPDASHVSKRWPLSKYVVLCMRLLAEGGVRRRLVLIAGPSGRHLTQAIAREAGERALDWGGRLNLRELGALLKRSSFLVSNDSGPVHIAGAVGTPVVAIFGRTQPGLSKVRWGPVGERDIILQNDPGCKPCIPDPCPIHLECLERLTVDEVMEACNRLMAKHV